ncbi:uncharacterized protein LY79DRAFT_288747 [Colletotrichum navitas]|uniref:Uncharacterized protein n=1 Tax=Colletotrichum navitas TaxID=681940 RepID=A0AAD8VB08_9PEZI|nr:uncharacterized protein LY79DRAFT_288747 [Colletotrichum navitas]KAK1598461.1 hypothetical protein LY79DRAFT_288747 [Colletotrichum navitas]
MICRSSLPVIVAGHRCRRPLIATVYPGHMLSDRWCRISRTDRTQYPLVVMARLTHLGKGVICSRISRPVHSPANTLVSGVHSICSTQWDPPPLLPVRCGGSSEGALRSRRELHPNHRLNC